MTQKRPKKGSEQRARDRVEALRAEQQAKERRRTLMLVGIAIVVGLGLVASAAIPLLTKARAQNRPVAEMGVSAAAASCGDILDDPSDGTNVHVGPGTAQSDVTHVDYDTNPPSHGPHFGQPAGIGRHFYTTADTPPVEQLVHNLEHGYTIVWYDDTVTGDQLADLESLSTKIATNLEPPKFIVAAWDESRGAFPEGHVALAHWSRDAGHRQYCGEVSGAAIWSFVQQFPSTDAWEPNSA